MTRKKIKWANLDSPVEAIQLGRTGFANDQIYRIAGDSLFEGRRTENETWLRQSGRSAQGLVNQIQKGAWVYPKRNDPEDPATIAFVVEQLLLLNWDAYISANNIYPFLLRNYTQMSWDTNVIGRILGGLATSAEMHDIMTKPSGYPIHMHRVRTHGQAQYAFEISQSTWLWLRAIRRLTGNVMHQQQEWLRQAPAERRESLDPGNGIWDRISAEIGYGGVDIRGDFTPDE